MGRTSPRTGGMGKMGKANKSHQNTVNLVRLSAHTYNPRNQEPEVGRLPQVQGQLELRSVTLSQEERTKQKTKTSNKTNTVSPIV